MNVNSKNPYDFTHNRNFGSTRYAKLEGALQKRIAEPWHEHFYGLSNKKVNTHTSKEPSIKNKIVGRVKEVVGKAIGDEKMVKKARQQRFDA